MMMNLFHPFDPNIINTPLNLFSLMMLMNLLMMKKKMLNYNYLINTLNNYMKKMMNMNINNKNNMLLIHSLLTLTLTMNMMNLIPNIMSPTSIMNYNLMMTMIMWFTMSTMLMMNKKIFLMNLSPKNTPMTMMVMINLIELTSLLFQILSLTMRLTINMMMGHIIMKMLSNYMFMMLYMLIECMIIMIQSYIFISLNMMNFNNTI